jgi:6-pyruvoyltetrahydropterin/6-carboxytetrahydropterin synthase
MGAGLFRICKRFEIESGHRLYKHPERCRFPHGHSRTVEVVLRATALDANDMVCDYKVLKELARRELDRFDHAMVLAAADPLAPTFQALSPRVVLLDDGDATTEVMARYLFRRLDAAFRRGGEVVSPEGTRYQVPPGVRVERVRVWETSTSWAEYGEEPDGL